MAREKPEVAVLALESFSQMGLVTYLATRLWLDLISGNGSLAGILRLYAWDSEKLRITQRENTLALIASIQ